MMFSKATIIATVLAVTQVAVATPPACLLAAVNTQQDPSDLKSVCKASEVMSTLKSACHGDYNTAMAAYKSVCKGAGVTISAPSSSNGGSSSHPSPRPSNASGGSGPKSSGGSDSTSNKSGSSPSGSSKDSPENAAGHLEAGAYMAMVVAGLVAAL